MQNYRRDPDMKVSALALGLTLGTLWGLAMCMIGIAHAIYPDYGREFFAFMGSIYPGMSNAGTVLNTVVAVVYGIVDGFLGGYLMAVVYNFFASRIGDR